MESPAKRQKNETYSSGLKGSMSSKNLDVGMIQKQQELQVYQKPLFYNSSLDVYVFNNQNSLPVSEKSVQALVNSVVSFEGHHFDEAAIHFVSVEAICSLHKQYFNDPSPTDCISFPMDDAKEQGYKVLGEVFVCPEVAKGYIQEKGGDLYEETSLYIVHGLLHLMGYEDMNNDERAKMRQAEKRHMENLKSTHCLLQKAEQP